MNVQCSSCGQKNRLPAARMRDKAKCAACKASLLPPTKPLAITSAQDFDELVRDAPEPVVVDFWAAWCGPCRMVGPELEKLASERAGQIVVAKVDTEALPDVAARFDVRNLPTMVCFRGGKEASRVMGAMPASQIASRLAL
jgi:thioredoxin 2